jgi:hypothetical protein
MAEFPADWDIFEEDEFATHDVSGQLEDPMAVSTLLKLDKNGKSTGVFRLALSGGGIVDIPIPATDILHKPPPTIADMVIKLSFRADKLTIATNSATSYWRDLLALLRSTVATVTDLNGDTISSDSLISYLDDLAKSEDKSTLGASIRFAVAASEDGALQLEVQSLPMQARYLTKAALKRDNCVSVLQGFFPLHADMFAGSNPGGPIPLFFAPDRNATLGRILNNPDQLRDDIATLNSIFFRMEHMTVEEAHTYLQGKARAAKGKQLFPPFMGPPSKRARTAQASYAETGINIYYVYHNSHRTPL